VIDMFFNSKDIDAIINLKRDIDDIRKKIIEDKKLWLKL